jgi:hypothetical protein
LPTNCTINAGDSSNTLRVFHVAISRQHWYTVYIWSSNLTLCVVNGKTHCMHFMTIFTCGVDGIHRLTLCRTPIEIKYIQTTASDKFTSKLLSGKSCISSCSLYQMDSVLNCSVFYHLVSTGLNFKFKLVYQCPLKMAMRDRWSRLLCMCLNETWVVCL